MRLNPDLEGPSNDALTITRPVPACCGGARGGAEQVHRPIRAQRTGSRFGGVHPVECFTSGGGLIGGERAAGDQVAVAVEGGALPGSVEAGPRGAFRLSCRWCVVRFGQ